MKYIIYCFTILIFFQANGQNSVKNLKLHEVKVGDPMPDIPLGTVMNNTTGKMRFSDFKGKLVILDFWATTCTSCIAGFPHMAALQKEFGDKIQIFLVNSGETEAEIKTMIAKRYKNKTNLFPTNLPSIVDAKSIGSLFPVKTGVPYHVWIDGSGIVRLRGIAFNTNKQKIEELLSGKEISFIRDGDGDFDKNLPLYNVVNKTTTPVIQFNSLFTRFSDQFFGGGWGDRIINQPDSIAGTMRNTFLNQTIYQLYSLATKEINREKEEIFSGNRVLLLVKDTLRYTDSRDWYSGPVTDKIMKDCRFSYEQVVPLDLSDSVRKQYMLEDLNRYFGALYGAVGSIEKRKMPCWLLIRTSNLDKMKTKGVLSASEFPIINGKTMSNYTNCEFKTAIQGFLNTVQESSTTFSADDIVINETGYSGKVDMVFPGWGEIKSIDDFRKALQVYDLDIIKGEREVKMLVIKEKDYK